LIGKNYNSRTVNYVSLPYSEFLSFKISFDNQTKIIDGYLFGKYVGFVDEDFEENNVDEKFKKKVKSQHKGNKKKLYMNNLMLNTDISFKSLENKEFKITSKLINGNLITTNYPEDEDYYDFAEFFIGDYETGSFKIKINSKNEKELYYSISILTKKDDESTVLKSAFLKSLSSNEKKSIKLKLPYGFLKTDIYFISIYCTEFDKKHKFHKSSNLDIKFKLNNN
tara:strand:- start:743 stop:1414 length:672 start_codon:yes stop_codon:yes gene_type:complete